MAACLCAVHNLTAFGIDKHLFAVHLVLGEVFDVRLAEVAQTAVEGDIGTFDTFDLHALHHRFAEMQSGRGCRHRTFILGKDALEALQIFGF